MQRRATATSENNLVKNGTQKNDREPRQSRLSSFIEVSETSGGSIERIGMINAPGR